MTAASEDDLTIEGFDVRAALVRTMGNREFYLQLLARFRDDQHDAADRITKALEDGETALAGHLAHTLKGVAGLVGAAHVSELAGELESAIQGGTNALALFAMLDRIEADMRLLMAGLARVLPAPQA